MFHSLCSNLRRYWPTTITRIISSASTSFVGSLGQSKLHAQLDSLGEAFLSTLYQDKSVIARIDGPIKIGV